MASKSAPKSRASDTSGSQNSKLSQNPSSFPRPKNYASQGVTDNDIFLLPGSDYQLLGVLTVIAAVVRLFRIYQPSSVVFDEVQ
jgi:dolichyl-phosphate-mannose-protein mannosyltransferase